MIRKIAIGDIERKGLQTRVALNEETVADYAEAMAKGVKFPPVTVFQCAGHLYLADGFHRVEGALRNGVKRIDAEITQGKFDDALKFALGANANHGLRRTNADKNRAVNIALQNCDRLFGGVPSANLLAETCAVSVEFANRMVREFESLSAPKRAVPTRRKAAVQPTPPSRVRVTRDGKTVTLPPNQPPKRPARAGYYIGKDGQEHAIGVALDRFGVEIPERIKAAFADERVDDWAHRVGTVKNEIKGLQTVGGNPVAASLQRAVIELENAYHEIKAAKPYCVCRMCQGNGCDACRDTGYQTQDQYNRNPKEFKA